MKDLYREKNKRLEKLKPLRFGTSGLRARVTEMTDMECYINTQGFVYFLIELGEVGQGKEIAVGGDLRSSTPRIMTAVCKAIQDKGYIYDHTGHGIPHDGAARELGTGRSRQETLRELGLLTHIIPRQSVADGIHAVRMLLQKDIWFHKTKCAQGIEAMKNYQRKWDGKNNIFMDKPLHNWASNPADAFRMLALDLDIPHERIDFAKLQKIKHNSDYDELSY